MVSVARVVRQVSVKCVCGIATDVLKQMHDLLFIVHAFTVFRCVRKIAKNDY